MDIVIPGGERHVESAGMDEPIHLLGDFSPFDLRITSPAKFEVDF
jgi:hypothetical protein